MTEPLVCESCGHDDEAHCPDTGICLARGCRCVTFRFLGEFEEDEDEEPEGWNELDELNFDR